MRQPTRRETPSSSPRRRKPTKETLRRLEAAYIDHLRDHLDCALTLSQQLRLDPAYYAIDIALLALIEGAKARGIRIRRNMTRT